MKNKIETELKKILADESFNSTSMQVPKQISKLVMAVNYLTTQLNIIKRYENDDELKLLIDIDGIFEQLYDILNK